KFNGGLFRKDDELDNYTIKDEILLKLINLSEKDFSSDLNVNILGHIFEQSISDIEEIKARIGIGESLSDEIKQDVRKNGKRKKDGIFYTPEYITRSIVKEAIGGWLNDRKTELGFFNLPELTKDDYASVHPVRRKSRETGKMYEKMAFNQNIEKHIAFWESYKEQLRQIKVLDPACGSGAFLNQAFDYLFEEGRKVNDELSLLRLGQREVFELDRHILTNNLYGVDINRESVEITKLSLWLKTANKGKELTSLDGNIKCGNSLIEDPEIAHDRAFDWFAEFTSVFPNYRKPHDFKHRENIDFAEEPSYNYKNPDSKGFIKFGFDVVIGNPPWGAQLDQISFTYLLEKYPVIPGKIKDTYFYFTLLALNLLKQKGYLGFITPNTWLLINNAKSFREYLLQFNNDAFIKYGKWLMYPSNQQRINEPKILLRRTSSDLKATYDEHCYYPQNSVFIITSSKYELKYLLVILNSRLMNYIYRQKCPQEGKIFAEVKPSIIKSLPIPEINRDQQMPFVNLADIMLAKTKELFGHKFNFLHLMKSKWPGINVNGNLSDWPSQPFESFMKELVKQKVSVSLKDQSEWLQFFNEQKGKAKELQTFISQTDKTINDLVNNLYQMTDQEIGIKDHQL
ncbi:MAG: TaqI-like C-terminal specificity domain-containing protein, partial [Bacteroidota bacterium]